MTREEKEFSYGQRDAREYTKEETSNVGPNENAKTDVRVQETKNTKKQPMRFKVAKRRMGDDFPIVYRATTTTEKLSKLIASIVKAVFSDCDSAFIEVGNRANGPQDLVLTLYFRPNYNNGIGAVPAIYEIGTETANSQPTQVSRRNKILGMNDIKRMNAQFIKNKFALTKEETELFERYVCMCFKNIKRTGFFGKDSKVNILWDKMITEVSENPNISLTGGFYRENTNQCLVKVTGLSVVEFLKSIYGDKYKTPEGTETVCAYRAIGGSVLAAVHGTPNNVIIIEQFSKYDTDRIIDYAGRPIMMGSVPRYC